MTAPILARSDVPGVPPTCTACGQHLPWHPPLCTCGHPVTGHEMADKGVRRLACTIRDTAGLCDCGRYEHAVDGGYGPGVTTP